MLREEANDPLLVASQALPDQQVVVFVILLREVNSLYLGMVQL